MNNQEYFDLNANHDWHYQGALRKDDYQRGHDETMELYSLAGENPTFKEIYVDWILYIFNGGDLPKVENY